VRQWVLHALYEWQQRATPAKAAEVPPPGVCVVAPGGGPYALTSGSGRVSSSSAYLPFASLVRASG